MASQPPVVTTPHKKADEHVPKSRLKALDPAWLETLRKTCRPTVEALPKQPSNEQVKRVLRMLDGHVKYSDLSGKMLNQIVKAEGISGMSALTRDVLRERLSVTPVQQPKRKAEESSLYSILEGLSENCQLEPKVCKKKLKSLGELKDGQQVFYIIPPSVGGVNHMDNLCVLPNTLSMPTDGEAHCVLMAGLLQKSKIIDAVKICKDAGGYAGASADDLASLAKDMLKPLSVCPWGRRGGGTAGTAGAAAASPDGAAAAAGAMVLHSTNGSLTPALCMSELKGAGMLKDGYNVFYIIPPSVGGVNHMDNLCVLPNTLSMPLDGEAHCLLMAALLPHSAIINAVTICKDAGGYAGASAEGLIAHTIRMREPASSFPWEQSQVTKQNTGPQGAADGLADAAATTAAAPGADGGAGAGAGAGAASPRAEECSLHGTMVLHSTNGSLTPALCMSELKGAGMLKDGYNVFYIIPPSVGGVNHMDNLCVLPNTLSMPPDGEAHCLLMAALLPDNKIVKAVEACQAKDGNTYTGTSAQELIAQAKSMRELASLIPWEQSQAEKLRTGQRGSDGGGAAAPAAPADAAISDGAAAGAAAGAPANEPPPVNGAQANQV